MKRRALRRRLRKIESRLTDLEKLTSPKRRHIRDLRAQVSKLDRRLKHLSRPVSTSLLRGRSAG